MFCNSKLVPIDKQKGRDAWYLSQNSPNEQRFININKSPEVLSSVRKAGSPDLKRTTGRKVKPVDKYRNDTIYNAKLDYVMSNSTGVVPDFKRYITRQDIVNTSVSHNDTIDSSLVTSGIELLSYKKRVI